MAALSCSARVNVAVKKAQAPKVAGFSRPLSRKMVVRASAQQEKRAVALSAGVVAAAGAMAASPLVAYAEVTPSLQNFFYSLLAGATVLAAIAGAITVVSNFDPVNRG